MNVPVIADCDTGFGGVHNVKRTIRMYEQEGIAGLHIEDQVMPKRCGHFEGKAVVPIEEMLYRLQAALDARFARFLEACFDVAHRGGTIILLLGQAIRDELLEIL